MLVTITLLMAMVGAGSEVPPTDAEVLRALQLATRGLPFVVGEFRDDVVIVTNRLKQKIVGPVVESHWECTAYYTRTIQLGFPFTATLKKPCVQVVYIDKLNVAK